MKEEKFSHMREALHWWRRGVVGGQLQNHRGELNNRSAEGKAERFLHTNQC